MSNNPNLINTTPISQFMAQVKAADLSKQKELRMDINTAKNLSHSLALVMTRLAGNYETLLQQPQKTPDISVSMDGGSWENNK